MNQYDSCILCTFSTNIHCYLKAWLLNIDSHLISLQVEQMHKIFKLCGSPSEDYWQRTKFPHATSFKPQHPYKRQVAQTFKNFSSSALALVDKLLTIEPEERGSATSALKSEVLLSSLLFFPFFFSHDDEVFQN